MEIRLTNKALRALQNRGIDLLKGSADFSNLDTQEDIIFEGTRHLDPAPESEAVRAFHESITPGETIAILTSAMQAAMGVKLEAAGSVAAGSKSAEAPEGGGK